MLFSSHILADVERVADHICILQEGRLQADCSVETFRNRVRYVLLRFPHDAPPMPSIPAVLRCRRLEREMSVTYVENDGSVRRQLEEQLAPAAMEDMPLLLEDAFIDYVSCREESNSLLTGRKS